MVFNILAMDFGAVMKTVGGVVLAIVILLAMVTIHEFGHYVAGKLLGFKINEFSVGFGPALLKKRSKKTGELFALRLIPLGGYCAFDGEDYDEDDVRNNAQKDEAEDKEQPFAEMQNEGGMVEVIEKSESEMPEENIVEKEEYPEPKGKRFNDQPPWKRIIVLAAGATMNYLLALIALFIMFGAWGCVHSFVGVRAEAIEQGVKVDSPVLEDDVIGYWDIILSVDGKDIYLANDYVDILSGKKQGDSVTIRLLRRNEEGAWIERSFDFVLLTDCECKNMSDLDPVLTALGLDSEVFGFGNVTVPEGFWETIGRAFVYSFKIGGTVLRSLGELLTFKLSITSMGGPVTTIAETAKLATSGWDNFLSISAFIGVNLAVFNLLPVPALDGCKIIFCLIEWIFKKPINRKVEAVINFVGIIVLFGFAILVDVLHFVL